MATELEQIELETAKLRLERERREVAKLQRRDAAAAQVVQGAADFGAAAGKGAATLGRAAGGVGSAVLRYVGRYLLWAAAYTVAVSLVYLMMAMPARGDSSFAQRLDALLAAPGNLGAFLVFVLPVINAAFPKLRISQGLGAAVLLLPTLLLFAQRM